MEDGILLEFNNFGFQYNAQSTPTLTGINFTLRRGERVLIAGPSGCGKSTLVHCINGLIPFSYKGEISGSLKIKGRETRDLSLFEISKTVGTVLQDSDAQFVGMTVAEDIAFALENDCVGEPELHDRVKRAAEMVDIDGFLAHAPGELSGGQKQRVSVAGVLVDDVDILIFDEPLANLDPATGKQAIELIDRMQEETGAAVVIVEHRLEDVLHRSVDRIVLMSNGSIVADLPPDELLSGSLLKECGIREPLYTVLYEYRRRVRIVIFEGFEIAEAAVFVDESILVIVAAVLRRVIHRISDQAHFRDVFHVDLYPLAGVGHLLVRLGNVLRVRQFYCHQASFP